MNYEEAIKYKNENYPDGTFIEKEITMRVFIVPNNHEHFEKYRKEVYGKFYKNRLTDEFAKSFSLDGDYGLHGFGFNRTLLIYKFIV